MRFLPAPPKFTIGQAVVLVEAFTAVPCPGDTMPRFGPIYHVREQFLGLSACNQHQWYLRLEELVNPVMPRGIECGFNENRFAAAEQLPQHELEELLRESLIKPEVFV